MSMVLNGDPRETSRADTSAYASSWQQPLQVLALPYSERADENPYQYLLYRHFDPALATVRGFKPWRLVFGRYDIWHLHWPESIFINIRYGAPQAALRLIKTWAYLKIARARRTKVVWTVHNLGSHEGRYGRLERLWMRLFCHDVAATICLSEGAVPLLHQRYPETKAKGLCVTPHGHYRGYYPDHVDRAGARRDLGIDADAEVTLFFGAVRPYKGVRGLVECFGKTAGSNRVLVVAGRAASPTLKAEIEAAAHGADVRFDWGFIPDDRVQTYFRAADLFVAPFRDVLNSGSAVLALSFDCPVLVPNKGAMAELQATVGTQWVRTFDGALAAETLDDAMAWARGRTGPAPLDALDWPGIAATTVNAFRATCSAVPKQQSAGRERMVEDATLS